MFHVPLFLLVPVEFVVERIDLLLGLVLRVAVAFLYLADQNVLARDSGSVILRHASVPAFVRVSFANSNRGSHGNSHRH